MSAIENTITNTIPVSTVFIGKAPRYLPHISLRRACQKCAVGALTFVTEWCFASIELKYVWNLRCAASCRASINRSHVQIIFDFDQGNRTLDAC